MYIFIGIGEKAESTIYYLRSTSRSSTTDPETFKEGNRGCGAAGVDLEACGRAQARPARFPDSCPS